MRTTNRGFLPAYCRPDVFLPRILETRTLFRHRPFLFSDFVGRAMRFLESNEIRKMGFRYEPGNTLPCKWKCSDESLFGVDLALYVYTGQYPFAKGKIGAHFNEAALAAATHHGSTNVDFGGSHVGYVPGPNGGSFGRIWRPAKQEYSTNCGYLCSVLEPFREVYDDACQNILLFRPAGEQYLISIPNEFLQPGWCRQSIKLLVDLETLTLGEVAFDEARPYTHARLGRTLFLAHPDFLGGLEPADVKRFSSPAPQPIGKCLTQSYFSIFDTSAPLDEDGIPCQKLLVYMPFILSARYSPDVLKAAVVNTTLEHNRMTDAIRGKAFLPFNFVGFTGVFIDLYDSAGQSYVNLFQPVGLTIKCAGQQQEVELSIDEIHDVIHRHSPAEPKVPILSMLGFAHPEAALRPFTYRPGQFA